MADAAVGGPGAWDDYDIIPCRDGKARRAEREPRALADGVPALLDALRDAGLGADEIVAARATFPIVSGQLGRVMLLRGYGNAIVPQLAAEFAAAWAEARRGPAVG